MITRLLRRLQGNALHASVGDTGQATVDVADVVELIQPPATASAPTGLDTATVERDFLALVLGAPPAQPASGPERDEAHVEPALHHLRMVAERFDVKRMPRLPALVPQLLASMRRDDSDAAQMAALLAKDPTLAGEVVRVANSAYYRRAAAITGLQQAVQTLGHEGLRHVLLTSVMRPILRAHPTQPGYAAAEWLWQQSETCTFLCSRLAPGRCDPGEAQLAGVVAGTGASALLRMASLPMLAPAAMAPRFAPGFALIARRLTARAAAHWQLPADIRSVLEATPDASDVGTPLAKVLRAAHLLSMASVLVEGERATSEAVADIDTGLAMPRTTRLELLDASRRERDATRALG